MGSGKSVVGCALQLQNAAAERLIRRNSRVVRWLGSSSSSSNKCVCPAVSLEAR